ncbi:hypothetical protein EV356DRAFT_80051 [Viridothelium virens]|uniref:Uncharacterized protein n=1 Tax=Viridothelium virens TaxID=1048519 RepID=A0A6A6HDW9_VIRVR|nr:hypothetical protein EV356DRAFT_80051 [Viridothelium virens]
MIMTPLWYKAPLIELPLRHINASIHIEPYMAWVALRIVDTIYQPTVDEVKQSLVSYPLRLQPGGQTPSWSSPSDYYWNVLTCNLCRRFAYLLGKISRFDRGVRTFFKDATLAGIDDGELVLSFLQQGLLMRFYQPGGIEPALVEVRGELEELQRREHDLMGQQITSRAVQNTQSLEDLRSELQRAMSHAWCTGDPTASLFEFC